MTQPDNGISISTKSTSADCDYLPPHQRKTKGGESEENSQCFCPPECNPSYCRCTGLSQRWAKECRSKKHKAPHQRALIAYLRTTGCDSPISEQRKTITDYCKDNEYYLKETFIDYGRPGHGLMSAMEAMAQADGLIVSDLDRFVEHYDDRQRDLKPFVHHFFCAPSKHLISVEEGVDTGSTQGQANAIEIISQVK